MKLTWVLAWGLASVVVPVSGFGALAGGPDPDMSAFLMRDSRQVLAYETAMVRYEVDLGNRLAAVPGAVYFIPAEQTEVWTWLGSAGSVRRLRSGYFRISSGPCLARFCASIECEDSGWPVFQCSDGLMRKMSVPDDVTMVFGDVTYRRPTGQPADEDVPVAPAPPESKKPAAGGGAAGFN